MTYFNEPELIEVRDWSVWLRFPTKVGQDEVYSLLASGLDCYDLENDLRWEIRPIRRIEEREGR